MEFKRLYEPDHRGEIYRLTFDDGSYINIIHTKAHKYRSGDIHPNIQHDLIIRGKVLFTLRDNLNSSHEKDTNYVLEQNDKIEIPEGVPHLFFSVTDSLVFEWWSGPFKADYYKPYRKIVDGQADNSNRYEVDIDFVKKMLEKERSPLTDEEKALLKLIGK